MPEIRYTDAQLAKLAETPFTGGRGLAGDLAAELLELRALLANRARTTDPQMTEADRMACEWSDYRKAYGVYADHLESAHKAFKAGWEAATGKTFEEGPVR